MEEAFRTGRVTPEQEFVIRMLSDHLYGMKTSSPDETLDWCSLASIAKSHEISGILYRQCRDFLPKEMKAELERQFGFALFQYTRRQDEEKRIDSALSEKSIPHFFIKGSAVAAFYPVPALRTMGDSDLVIQGENRETVDVILKQLGFICVSKDNYQKQALKLEVHDHLVHAGSIVSCEMAEFFNTVWAYVEDGKLDWSFHFLFLLVHLRGHFTGAGVGLRQFMDLAVIMKHDLGLNWPWIQERLTEFDLLPFAKNVFALNEKWFSVKSPIDTSDIQDSFLDEATDFIIRNGVFGSKNEENRAGYLARDHADARFPVFYMLRNAWGKVFIPYRYMITMPQYAFLKGRPLLLPAAWFYRGYYTIRTKGTKLPVHALRSSFTTNDAIQRRAELLKEWGIHG